MARSVIGPIFFRSGTCAWAGVTAAAIWLGASLTQGVAADAKPEPVKISAPEDVSLTTRDGLELGATFYGGTKGKDSVPVVLLHMFKKSRGDYKDLALHLQSLGHAVIVPDLRGHGTSKKGINGKPLDAASPNFGRDNFTAMVTSDMEAVKGFLLAKNNAGELNIEKLCVIGAEMGAVIALNWSYGDWNAPVLLTGKQGQDVKALVLISPEVSFHGMSIKQAVTDDKVRRRLSILMLVGKGKPKAVADTERVYAFFRPFHVEPPPEKKLEEQDLFFGKLDTPLQGTDMLNAKGLNVGASIAQFITLRLEKKSFPWKERKMQ